MYTAEQRQYLEDVLGMSYLPTEFAEGWANDSTGDPQVQVTEPAPELVDVLVLTDHLDDERRTLLVKILASVKLQTYRHLEVEDPAVKPLAILAAHTLEFAGRPCGKREGSIWSLPRLNAMTGQSADVAARKKEAWACLQQFAREWSQS